jgi:hypothetical protein
MDKNIEMHINLSLKKPKKLSERKGLPKSQSKKLNSGRKSAGRLTDLTSSGKRPKREHNEDHVLRPVDTFGNYQPRQSIDNLAKTRRNSFERARLQKGKSGEGFMRKSTDKLRRQSASA